MAEPSPPQWKKIALKTNISKHLRDVTRRSAGFASLVPSGIQAENPADRWLGALAQDKSDENARKLPHTLLV
jgi:hypothetical protein